MTQLLPHLSLSQTTIALLVVVSLLSLIGFYLAGRLWYRLNRSETEKRDLQDRLIQSQKMDTIGRLSGGIAHDFNNLLLGISGNLELLKQNPMRSAQEHEQLIDSAQGCADRARKLIRRLLDFSRAPELNLAVGNLNESIRQVAHLSKTLLGPNVELQLNLSDQLAPVVYDRILMEQVLMNILLNARDAFPNGQGTILIGTRNLRAEEVDEIADEGSFTVITVQDDGDGMTDVVMEKIFEPFFTTKTPEMGTGLGLSMSNEIVKQHRGRIDVSSLLGEGSRFDIFLPCRQTEYSIEDTDVFAASQDPESRSDSEPPSPVAGVETGVQQSPSKPCVASTGNEKCRGHVLLADDDDAVRRVGETALSALGFRVSSVGNGITLLDKLADDDSIDLVLLDLTMPQMSGTGALVKIKQGHPQIPVVICSGFVQNAEEFQNATGIQPAGFLRKPYRLREIESVIRQAIERSNHCPQRLIPS